MPVYRATINLTWSGATGSPGTNTHHFRTTGTNDSGELTGAAEALQDFYISLSNYVPAQVQMAFQGDWYLVSGGEQGTIVQVDPWQQAGTAAGGFLPMGTSILLERFAATGGRSGRGHLFLGPVATQAGDALGSVAEGVRQAIQTQANNSFINSDQGGNFCLVSRSTGLARDIVGHNVPNIFGLLRSRRD